MTQRAMENTPNSAKTAPIVIAPSTQATPTPGRKSRFSNCRAVPRVPLTLVVAVTVSVLRAAEVGRAMVGAAGRVAAPVACGEGEPVAPGVGVSVISGVGVLVGARFETTMRTVTGGQGKLPR